MQNITIEQLEQLNQERNEVTAKGKAKKDLSGFVI